MDFASFALLSIGVLSWSRLHNRDGKTEDARNEGSHDLCRLFMHSLHVPFAFQKKKDNKKKDDDTNTTPLTPRQTASGGQKIHPDLKNLLLSSFCKLRAWRSGAMCSPEEDVRSQKCHFSFVSETHIPCSRRVLRWYPSWFSGQNSHFWHILQQLKSARFAFQQNIFDRNFSGWKSSFSSQNFSFCSAERGCTFLSLLFLQVKHKKWAKGKDTVNSERGCLFGWQAVFRVENAPSHVVRLL